MSPGTTILLVLGVLAAISIAFVIALRRAQRIDMRAESEAARRVGLEQDAARKEDEAELLDMSLDELAAEWDRMEDR